MSEMDEKEEEMTGSEEVLDDDDDVDMEEEELSTCFDSLSVNISSIVDMNISQYNRSFHVWNK